MSLYENYSNKTDSHSDSNALSDFVYMHSNGVHVSVRRLLSSLSFYHQEQTEMFPKGYVSAKMWVLIFTPGRRAEAKDEQDYTLRQIHCVIKIIKLDLIREDDKYARLEVLTAALLF